MEFETGSWFGNLVRQIMRRLVNYFLFMMFSFTMYSLLGLIFFVYLIDPVQFQAMGDTVLHTLLGVTDMIVSLS